MEKAGLGSIEEAASDIDAAHLADLAQGFANGRSVAASEGAVGSALQVGQS